MRLEFKFLLQEKKLQNTHTHTHTQNKLVEAKNMLLNNKCIAESMKEEIKHIQRPKK